MSTAQKIQVAIVGVGLVGSELISQLLAVTKPSPFQIVAVTSSKKTLFGSSLGSDWKSSLDGSQTKADIPALTTHLEGLLPNGKVVVVDNTSSDDIAAFYPRWLAAGINVVTPNKKAFSGELSLYEKIVESSKASGARFLNESTVGAGLPIISTLKELVITGDEITKIEGVFSGTMSYIFNQYSNGSPEGPSFSSVVSEAREKGYTEPHPADDLNGFDVARKLTILSRTISPSSSITSFASVQTASLIPAALEGIPTGDEFIRRLPEFDAQFDATRKEAAAAKEVLRFVGVVEPSTGTVKAGLERYPTSHPFATSLGGSDNIIMFHTKRYGARPLIVQGAGAGAAVTAMGVLGDLFKLV